MKNSQVLAVPAIEPPAPPRIILPQGLFWRAAEGLLDVAALLQDATTRNMQFG